VGNVVGGRLWIPQSRTIFASAERCIWWTVHLCDGDDPIRYDKSWHGDLFGTAINRPGNDCPEPVFHLVFRVQLGDSYLSSLTGVF